jgi:hypothetical protein
VCPVNYAADSRIGIYDSSSVACLAESSCGRHTAPIKLDATTNLYQCKTVQMYAREELCFNLLDMDRCPTVVLCQFDLRNLQDKLTTMMPLSALGSSLSVPLYVI